MVGNVIDEVDHMQLVCEPHTTISQRPIDNEREGKEKERREGEEGEREEGGGGGEREKRKHHLALGWFLYLYISCAPFCLLPGYERCNFVALITCPGMVEYPGLSCLGR